MLRLTHISILILGLAALQVSAQENGDEAPFFECPEANGKFRDDEQCDLFYICRKGVATIEYCPEGLLFDDSIPNHEKCVLPHNVDCGSREFVQEPSPDRDPKCEKANGVFNFPDETVCDKYIQCDNGRAFEFPCPNPLIFDVKVGSCVRKEQASELARLCDGEVFNEVDGFSCPGGMLLDHRICCKHIQFMLTPLTADIISHAITTRNPISLAAARETYLTA